MSKSTLVRDYTLHIATAACSLVRMLKCQINLQPATSNQDAKKWMDQGECLNQLNFSFGMKSDVRQCPETWCTTFLLELQSKTMSDRYPAATGLWSWRGFVEMEWVCTFSGDVRRSATFAAWWRELRSARHGTSGTSWGFFTCFSSSWGKNPQEKWIGIQLDMWEKLDCWWSKCCSCWSLPKADQHRGCEQ